MTEEFSGSLRERATVLRGFQVLDDSGNMSAQRTALAQLWLALRAVEGGVTISGEGRVAPQRFRARLRARDDLLLSDLLRWRRGDLRVLKIERDPQSPAEMSLLLEEISS